MSAGPGVLSSRNRFSLLLVKSLNVGDDGGRGTILANIDSAERLAADVSMPRYRQADIEQPRLVDDDVPILPAVHRAPEQLAQLDLFDTGFFGEPDGRGPFFRASDHGIVAWSGLDRALAGAAVPDPAFLDAPGHACRFVESELPQAGSWLSIVALQSDLGRTIPDEALA